MTDVQGVDSTNGADAASANLPPGSVVFGYANGLYTWTEADWAHFPPDEYKRVTLAVYIPGQDCTAVEADGLDVEAEYITPESPNRPDALNQAHRWSSNRRNAGKQPGWYTSLDARAELEPVVGTPGAWLIADWTSPPAPHEAPGTDVAGTQYASPSNPVEGQGHYDLWSIHSETFDPWYDANHGAAPPSPPPPPPPPPGEPLVTVTVPQLQQGATGASVSSLQRLLDDVAVDGIFGPNTEAAVRSYQSSHGLATDGIVGPHTWGSLLGHPQ